MSNMGSDDHQKRTNEKKTLCFSDFEKKLMTVTPIRRVHALKSLKGEQKDIEIR